MFVPSRCYGQNPHVCRLGVKTHVDQYACDYGIITDKAKHREKCVVTLRKTDTYSKLDEITPGEYVLVTWGETVQEMCVGSPPKDHILEAGVYTITLRNECVMIGRQWKVTPLKESKGCLSILALQIEIEPLNVHEYVDHEKVTHLIHRFGHDKLNPIVRKSLSSLPEWDDDEPIDEPQISTTCMYSVMGIVVINLIIGIGVVAYHCRMKYRQTKKEADDEPENCDSKQSEAAPEPITVATLFPSLKTETIETTDDFERIACA